MSFVNYYEVLEVDKAVDVDEIRNAIRSQRRGWRQRQGHPNVEVRSRAEKMTQHISDAEAVLLEVSKRAEYDRRLAAHTDQSPPSTTPGAGRDWLAAARGYLDAGSASQANYAAREATSQQPQNPDAWYLRANSSLLLGNLAEAEFEIGESIRLAPNNPVYYCELGDIYASAEQWNRSQQAYERASTLEPANHFYSVGIAMMLTAQGRAKDAMPRFEKAVADQPTNEFFKLQYAMCLLDSTTDQWSRYGDDTSAILNEAQLALTRKNLSEVQELRISDLEMNRHVQEIARLADSAERVRWFESDNLIAYLIGLVAAFIAMAIAFGIASGGSGGAATVGILLLGAAILIPVVFVKRHRMPGWKWDQNHSPAFVRQTGIQPTTTTGR